MSVRSRMSGFAGGARLPGTAVVRAMHLRLRSGFRSGLSGLDADTTNSSWPFRCHRRAQEAAHRRLLRLLHILGVCLALTGCAGTSIMPGASGSVFGSTPERANLTPAQACAIGYDMARRHCQVVCQRLQRAVGGVVRRSSQGHSHSKDRGHPIGRGGMRWRRGDNGGGGRLC